MLGIKSDHFKLQELKSLITYQKKRIEISNKLS